MTMDRMLNFLLPRRVDRSTATGLLFVRLVAGTALPAPSPIFPRYVEAAA